MTDDSIDDRLHYVAPVAAFDDTNRVIATVNGREIGIFEIEEEFYGLSNFCVHQGGPSCEGQISGTVTETEDGELTYEKDGELVSCPWHGWTFDIKTGRLDARPEDYRLPTYDVEVINDEVYVSL